MTRCLLGLRVLGSAMELWAGDGCRAGVPKLLTRSGGCENGHVASRCTCLIDNIDRYTYMTYRMSYINYCQLGWMSSGVPAQGGES